MRSTEPDAEVHWTRDELIATLYGIGPSGNHLENCKECRARLAEMSGNRELHESVFSPEEAVGSDFLAAQRRSIYQRMEQPVSWWTTPVIRRFAAGVTTAGLLTGSIILYQHNRELQRARDQVSDAQLVQQVAAMASDSDVSSMAPLQGLFE